MLQLQYTFCCSCFLHGFICFLTFSCWFLLVFRWPSYCLLATVPFLPSFYAFIVYSYMRFVVFMCNLSPSSAFCGQHLWVVCILSIYAINCLHVPYTICRLYTFCRFLMNNSSLLGQFIDCRVICSQQGDLLLPKEIDYIIDVVF